MYFLNPSTPDEYGCITKVALIPYITAGDPDLSTTAKALKVLDSCGADLIEVGVPYSDPLADGPVIQVALESTNIIILPIILEPFSLIRQFRPLLIFTGCSYACVVTWSQL